jgi:hypothetical protein
MALRLGLDYQGRAQDTPEALVRQGWEAIRGARLPLGMSVTHMAWFGVLAMAPAPLALCLYRLRANRSALWQTVRQGLDVLRGRFRRAAKASS